MTTWITADQHYGHANIIKFCTYNLDDVIKRLSEIEPHDKV